jgi:hypothetical protein
MSPTSRLVTTLQSKIGASWSERLSASLIGWRMPINRRRGGRNILSVIPLPLALRGYVSRHPRAYKEKDHEANA